MWNYRKQVMFFDSNFISDYVSELQPLNFPRAKEWWVLIFEIFWMYNHIIIKYWVNFQHLFLRNLSLDIASSLNKFCFSPNFGFLKTENILYEIDEKEKLFWQRAIRSFRDTVVQSYFHTWAWPPPSEFFLVLNFQLMKKN